MQIMFEEQPSDVGESAVESDWSSPDVYSLRLVPDLTDIARGLSEYGFEDYHRRFPGLIALQICHESRKYTLEHYQKMENLRNREGVFHFSPRCDALWLHLDDLLNMDHCMQELRACYGQQLCAIKTLVLTAEDDFEWYDESNTKRISQYFMPFTGLSTVLIPIDYASGSPRPDVGILSADNPLKARALCKETYFHAQAHEMRGQIMSSAGFLGWKIDHIQCFCLDEEGVIY